MQQLLTEAQQSSVALLGILEDQQQAQHALRESEEYMRQIGDNLPGGFIFQVRVETDGRHRLLHISAGVMRINGVSQQEALADIGVLYRQYMDDDWARCAAVLAEAERTFSEYRVEVRMRRPDGEVRWCLQTAAPRRLADGRLLWNGIVLDITEHKRAEILLGGEKIVLELMAKGVPLAEILMVITRNVEAQSNDTLCSILLLDADGIHLRHGAAPSLPEAYNLAVDGEAIGASAGSCGTAVYRKQQVIVTDIETDPLWTDYRELALEHGLRACWSTPILAAGGRILGSFALYHRTPRAPDQADFDIIERLTHLTGIAIETAGRYSPAKYSMRASSGNKSNSQGRQSNF